MTMNFFPEEDRAARQLAQSPTIERTQELQWFMMSVKRVHSGTFAGSYHAQGGAYGIPAKHWDTMARRAGLSGAQMSDPAMQDYVAAWTMKSYYARYNNWNLVALAWKEGTGAADEVVKTSGKAPTAVTVGDIENYGYDSGFVSGVSKNMARAGYKGLTEANLSNETLQDAAQNPTAIITGTGRVAMEDTYSATVRELYGQAMERERMNQPSAAEVMFSQLDTWSRSVAGGDRMDYRTDISTVQAERGAGEGSGGGQELEPMTIRPREETE